MNNSEFNNKVQINREQAEASLQESNSFLNSVIENIPNMIFVKDAKELRFVRINKSGEDLLGLNREELIGKNDYDFFPKSQADFFTIKDREVLNSGVLFDIPEEPIYTRSKGLRTLHTKKIPILDQFGKPIYLLGISEDITEKKKLEKEILEISDREQERIGQNLHDGLGQLLTGISFLAKALHQKLPTTSPESEDALKISELINHAIDQTRNLAALLFPIELETGNLFEVLSEFVIKMKAMFTIDVNLDVEENLKMPNKGLSLNLYRIIQESLMNAIKHASPTFVNLKFSKSLDGFLLEIENDGKNFEIQNQKKTGMGISMIQHRAKVIGGNVEFLPRLSGGTVVRIFVPLGGSNEL